MRVLTQVALVLNNTNEIYEVKSVDS